MDNIYKYNTTLKASGNDYKKIVFWNRFLRNPVELILSWVPAVISIIMLASGRYNTFLLIIYEYAGSILYTYLHSSSNQALITT